MKYYNAKGEPLKRKGKTVYYYNPQGKLVPVPTIADGKKEMLDFVEICVRDRYLEVSRDYLEYLWDEQLKKLPLIIDHLEALRLSNIGDFYRERSYRNAIKVLQETDVPIVSGAQAQKLKGIGKSIAAKIDEILETGKLRIIDIQAEEIQQKRSREEVLKSFRSVWGVGKIKAREWYSKGHRSLADIKKYEYNTLNEGQKLTLDFHQEINTPISRKAISKQKEYLEVFLYVIDPKANFEIVGSYRRRLPRMKDVDIMISSKKGRQVLDKYIDSLEVEGVVVYVLQRKKEKITTLTQVFGGLKKTDFFWVPCNSWATGLLAWTGSDRFVREMRARAARKGYKLNAEELVNTRTGEVVPTPTERSVFRVLGMKYIPPEKRF